MRKIIVAFASVMAWLLALGGIAYAPPVIDYTVVVTTAAALGNVVSAASGDTTFHIDSSSGTVSRLSGTGIRLTSGNTRALITVGCISGILCNNTKVNVKIGDFGSPTLRARALTNFTVTMGSATLSHAPGTGNAISFQLQPIADGTTQTFYVGFDYPIGGNEVSNPASGAAGSGFYVYADDANPPTTGATSVVTAAVFRPISLSNPIGLQFGTIVRPASGSGSVAIDAASGTRTPSGGAVGLSSPAPSKATYSVGGEGGQAFSLSIPASFSMTTTGGSITVTLTSTATGSQNLDSTLGSAGTFPFSIGGSIPVSSTSVSGAYNGSFTVSVQYN